MNIRLSGWYLIGSFAVSMALLSAAIGEDNTNSWSLAYAMQRTGQSTVLRVSIHWTGTVGGKRLIVREGDSVREVPVSWSLPDFIQASIPLPHAEGASPTPLKLTWGSVVLPAPPLDSGDAPSLLIYAFKATGESKLVQREDLELAHIVAISQHSGTLPTASLEARIQGLLTQPSLDNVQLSPSIICGLLLLEAQELNIDTHNLKTSSQVEGALADFMSGRIAYHAGKLDLAHRNLRKAFLEAETQSLRWLSALALLELSRNAPKGTDDTASAQEPSTMATDLSVALKALDENWPGISSRPGLLRHAGLQLMRWDNAQAAKLALGAWLVVVDDGGDAVGRFWYARALEEVGDVDAARREFFELSHEPVLPAEIARETRKRLAEMQP